MSRIPTPPLDTATGATAEVYAQINKAAGKVPNTFATNLLTRSGLLREDLDYHLVRASMAGDPRGGRFDRHLRDDRHDHSIHAEWLGRVCRRLSRNDRQRPVPDEGRRAARRLLLSPEAGRGARRPA